MKAVTGKDTKVIDLKGKMVMPGLVDTHIHALRGALAGLGLAFPVEKIHKTKVLKTVLRGHTVYEAKDN